MFKLILFTMPIAVLLLIISELPYRATQTTPAPSQLMVYPTSPQPTPTLIQPLPYKVLDNNNYHVYQTFNNCGPAALSMAFSYYGIFESQQKLGQDLRPYQNENGDNDDKSVTLSELAEKAAEYGFIPYHRPNGNIELMKQFITNDIPVITRTLTKEDEDIGHYRVVKGYDDTTHQLIQDDSLQGKNLQFTYEEFSTLWKQFNYEYLVLVPKDKAQIAQQILGENSDAKTAWRKAAQNAKQELEKNPDDTYARFNLSVALFNSGEYQRSIEEFEKVENQLLFRTLWYQIEPIQAYYELQNYERVFEMTDRILNNYNRAFSELYLIRGKIYLTQGNTIAAKEEFEKAVFYNRNLKSAQEALNSANTS